MIIINIDGLCEPNNPGGIATFGVIAKRDGNLIAEERGLAGVGPAFSNNVAEYAALVHALQILLAGNYADISITIKSDSKLVVNQMRGTWACHGGLYLETKKEADKLFRKLNRPITFEWIPREQNEEADALSRSAYENYCKSHGIEALYMQSKHIKDPTFRNTDDIDDKEVIETCSFDETRKVLESMKKSPAPDIITQDETPVLKGAPSQKVNIQFPNILLPGPPSSGPQTLIRHEFDNLPTPSEFKPDWYDHPSEKVMQEFKQFPVNSKGSREAILETCKDCKWLQWHGPHAGCFPNGKYIKWLPKKFMRTNKCENFKKIDPHGAKSEQEELREKYGEDEEWGRG